MRGEKSPKSGTKVSKGPSTGPEKHFGPMTKKYSGPNYPQKGVFGFDTGTK